ncbi:MAG TPA: 6-hydroxymethylpterin diphosphokinase MptE-like protein [Mobilitalea sp.]|nr:6-hydroxymethylpterin diphosphokinase MptE-like protein [Mobilitalea sp.]
MNDNINSLYKINKVLLAEIERIITALREQNFDLALRKVAGAIDYINILMDLLPSCRDYFLAKGIELDENIFIPIISELFDAQERKDYIVLADIYELRLASTLYQLQGVIISEEENIIESVLYIDNIKVINEIDTNLGNCLESDTNLSSLNRDGYYIEPTSGGDMTLAVGSGANKYYLHSNVNVWKEAALLARSWNNKDKTKYIIYGLGLGYHVYETHLLDTYRDIEVYESNIHIIRLACAYTDNIKLFQNPQITLVYDPDFTKLAARIDHMDEATELVIHYPSLETVTNKKLKERMENYFIQQSSVKGQLTLLNGNFIRNIINYSHTVDELLAKFKGRSLYIVAAGPSLDKNFTHLKEIGDKGIILATGTVFKKLVNAGITPDYVLVTDANERVYMQIFGFENSDVPMLFLSTAYYGFAAKYKGEKYMICQKDFPKAEEFARGKELLLFQTGGSVSTTALDLGITFGCKRIIFLGLDLAYTDNFAHASDTSRRVAADFDNLRKVEDIYGNMIPTSRTLDMYREWIENRIKGIDDIEFIDATEGGARIKGMRIAKLEDVI